MQRRWPFYSLRSVFCRLLHLDFSLQLFSLMHESIYRAGFEMLLWSSMLMPEKKTGPKVFLIVIQDYNGKKKKKKRKWQLIPQHNMFARYVLIWFLESVDSDLIQNIKKKNQTNLFKTSRLFPIFDGMGFTSTLKFPKNPTWLSSNFVFAAWKRCLVSITSSYQWNYLLVSLVFGRFKLVFFCDPSFPELGSRLIAISPFNSHKINHLIFLNAAEGRCLY